jgi:hypothetical protein
MGESTFSSLAEAKNQHQNLKKHLKQKDAQYDV